MEQKRHLVVLPGVYKAAKTEFLPLCCIPVAAAFSIQMWVAGALESYQKALPNWLLAESHSSLLQFSFPGPGFAQVSLGQQLFLLPLSAVELSLRKTLYLFPLETSIQIHLCPLHNPHWFLRCSLVTKACIFLVSTLQTAALHLSGHQILEITFQGKQCIFSLLAGNKRWNADIGMPEANRATTWKRMCSYFTELMIRHQVSSLLNMDGSYAHFCPLGSCTPLPNLEPVTLCRWFQLKLLNCVRACLIMWFYTSRFMQFMPCGPHVLARPSWFVAIEYLSWTES